MLFLSNFTTPAEGDRSRKSNGPTSTEPVAFITRSSDRLATMAMTSCLREFVKKYDKRERGEKQGRCVFASHYKRKFEKTRHVYLIAKKTRKIVRWKQRVDFENEKDDRRGHGGWANCKHAGSVMKTRTSQTINPLCHLNRGRCVLRGCGRVVNRYWNGYRFIAISIALQTRLREKEREIWCLRKTTRTQMITRVDDN